MHRTPVLSAVVLFTLAIGIGANTLIFSVVHTLLLKPLPYAEPERLAAVQTMEGARWRPTLTAPPDYYSYRSRNRTFAFVEAYYTRSINLTGGSRPEMVATFLPARRAASLDPYATLRAD